MSAPAPRGTAESDLARPVLYLRWVGIRIAVAVTAVLLLLLVIADSAVLLAFTHGGQLVVGPRLVDGSRPVVLLVPSTTDTKLTPTAANTLVLMPTGGDPKLAGWMASQSASGEQPVLTLHDGSDLVAPVARHPMLQPVLPLATALAVGALFVLAGRDQRARARALADPRDR